MFASDNLWMMKNLILLQKSIDFSAIFDQPLQIKVNKVEYPDWSCFYHQLFFSHNDQNIKLQIRFSGSIASSTTMADVFKLFNPEKLLTFSLSFFLKFTSFGLAQTSILPILFALQWYRLLFFSTQNQPNYQLIELVTFCSCLRTK